MALKQDERALLQLVCERGQSYADLAGLLGISEDAVREKAQSALAELGGAEPDAEVGLTDYLLGQADPIGRADVVRHLQQDAEARELAATIVAKLSVVAPNAQMPRLPEPKGRRRRAAAAPPGEAATATGADEPGQAPGVAAAPRAPRPENQSRMIAGLVGAGVILLFVILAVAGVFGGGDDVSGEEQAAAAQQEVTSVPLEPQSGSGVGGQADFGLANDNLFVDLSLNGLDPDLGRERVYVLWLMISDGGGYPVSIIVPGQNGNVQDRYAVPTPVAVAVAGNAQSVQVSESPSRQLRREIDRAVEAGAPLVPFSGDVLAAGDIPLAEEGGGVQAPEGAGADGAATPDAGSLPDGGGSGSGQGG